MTTAIGFVEDGKIYMGCNSTLNINDFSQNGVKYICNSKFVLCFSGDFETFNFIEELIYTNKYDRDIEGLIRIIRITLDRVKINHKHEKECDKILFADFSGLYDISIFKDFSSYTMTDKMAIGSEDVIALAAFETIKLIESKYEYLKTFDGEKKLDCILRCTININPYSSLPANKFKVEMKGQKVNIIK